MAPQKGLKFKYGDLIDNGFEVRLDPLLDDPGHCLIRPGPSQNTTLEKWALTRSGLDQNDRTTWHDLTQLLYDLGLPFTPDAR